MEGGSTRRKARHLHKRQHEHRINTQIFMRWVGFETTISAFERVKIVHALDGAATVIGTQTNIRTEKVYLT
jgi:hypothetical protein